MQSLLERSSSALRGIQSAQKSERRQRKLVFRQQRNRLKSVYPDAVSQQLYQNRTMIHYAFSRAMRTVTEHVPVESSEVARIALGHVLPQLFEHLMEASTIYEHVSRYVDSEGGQAGGAFDSGQTMASAVLNRVSGALRYTTSRVERDNMGLVQGIALEVLCAHVPMFNPVRSFVQNQLYDENDHVQVPLKQTALFAVSAGLVAYALYSQPRRTDLAAVYVCALAAFYAGTYQLTEIVTRERESMLLHEDSDADE